MADIPADITTKAVLEGFGDADSGTFSGRLETAGDLDWIKVELIAGQTYNFLACVLDDGSATNGDSFISIFDSAGVLVPGKTDDDGGVDLNSFLKSFIPAATGTYFIEVSSLGAHTGDYSLFVVQDATFFSSSVELTNGNDVFTGIIADRRILGGTGSDAITIGAGRDALGEQGNDIIIGNGLANRISGGLGHDTIDGGGDSDILFGDAGNDIIYGGDGFDSIFGGLGDDFIDGGPGADFITGGGGKDFLAGGADNNFFVYRSTAESPRGAGRDVITDFDADDSIFLSAIDAKRGGADNEFKFIGTHSFHHKASELRYVEHDVANPANDKTIIQGDVNGDGRADFEIELTGLHVLQPSNFLL